MDRATATILDHQQGQIAALVFVLSELLQGLEPNDRARLFRRLRANLQEIRLKHGLNSMPAPDGQRPGAILTDVFLKGYDTVEDELAKLALPDRTGGK